MLPKFKAFTRFWLITAIALVLNLQYLTAQCNLSAPTFGNNDAVCRTETTLLNGGLRVSCASCTGGTAATITWWTAATGGVKVGTGNPFNPLASGVVNNTTVGVTRFYAQCECNGCVSPTRTTVEFRVFDRPDPIITGSNLVCPGSTTNYSTPAVGGNAYTWTVTPANFGTIVSGANTNAVQIRWTATEDAGPFTIKITQTNTSGCVSSREMTVYTRKTTLTCLADVNQSLGDNCLGSLSVTQLTGIVRGANDVRVQMFNQAGFLLEDGYGTVSVDGVSTTGTRYDLIGRSFRYKITESCRNTECNGDIFFADKTPPAMTCPSDVSVSCVQFSQQTTPDTSITGKPTVSDCTPTRLTYTDIVRTVACTSPFAAIPNDLLAIKNSALPNTGDIVKIILRTFLAIDNFDNERTCHQYIFVRRAALKNVVCPVRNQEYRCEDYFSVAPTPSVSGEPLLDVDGNLATTNDQIPILRGSCDFTVTFSDQVQGICNNSRRVIRTWVITDICTWESTTCTQILNIVDKTPPSVKAEFAQTYVVDNQLFRRDTVVNFDGFSINRFHAQYADQLRWHGAFDDSR
jgi:PKD-like domain